MREVRRQDSDDALGGTTARRERDDRNNDAAEMLARAMARMVDAVAARLVIAARVDGMHRRRGAVIAHLLRRVGV